MEKRALGMSILGFGCLRFAKKGMKTDIDEVEREIRHAIERGINYFDTAFVYGDSEKVLGEVLKRNNLRENVMIATKLPHYLMSSISGAEKLFNEQLKRLQTDYIDNYLIHMLPDMKAWNALVDMGIADWLLEKKRSGQIRHIGFSYHGNTENFLKLLDAYPWEFCQVQYNYMDEHTQAGREGVEYAYSKNIPVIIMEPLRGGRLVNSLPEKALDIFEKAEPKRTPAEWALRWLWEQKEVSCILSGMNSMEMLDENIRIADSVQIGEFTEKQRDMLNKVKAAINEKVKVPCTACGYCSPCPFGVDIPGVFRCYNECFIDNPHTGFKSYLRCTTIKASPSYASLCKKCGRCEKHCPQGIKIREELDNARRQLEGFSFHVVDAGCKFAFRKARRKEKN